jgi:hypothetical protein
MIGIDSPRFGQFGLCFVDGRHGHRVLRRQSTFPLVHILRNEELFEIRQFFLILLVVGFFGDRLLQVKDCVLIFTLGFEHDRRVEFLFSCRYAGNQESGQKNKQHHAKRSTFDHLFPCFDFLSNR